jgi:hypothetical protein
MVVYRTPFKTTGVPLIVTVVLPPPPAGPPPAFGRITQARESAFTLLVLILDKALNRRPE